MTRKEARSRTLTHWKRHLVWIASGAGVLGIALLLRSVDGPHPAAAQTSGGAAETGASTTNAGNRQAAAPVASDVAAQVNGKDIRREQLMQACVRRHGETVLESIVNKRLIMSHCEKRGITVMNEEIAAEVDRMAKRFNLGTEQWLELLETERGVTAQEYARDIIWPTLALRKLAAKDLQVSDAEVQRSYEREYGEMIRARLIAVGEREQAAELREELVAKPDNFARIAIEHSIDVNSASVGGLIQPIRRHVGDQAIEREAFRLQAGEISQVIPVGDQFVLLKCEGRIPARHAVTIASVRKRIVETIKDEKLRAVAQSLFSQLQRSATIQNVYNDPRLRETMPGVVASVNGDRITMKQLGEECLLRHGEEVLEIEISQLILEQALQTARLSVSQADLDAEMRHAAELAGVVDDQGDADLAKWIEMATSEQGISRDQYLRDSVWPSAALKKLTAQDVRVDEADIRKGFEANYGERVRCRAIVLGEMRRAQEVWDKARRNPTEQYFGDLAAEYSIEPTSKALRGEVPPIGRYGGQPQVEEVAFSLEPGQLSGIIQVGDKFIVLRCEGRTERVEVDEVEVREILRRDIYEKKLRIAMSKKFEEIREQSRINNYLAGTSTGGQESASKGPIHRDTAVRPTSGTSR